MAIAPHCGARYGFGPDDRNECEHLLCEDYFDEGPFVFRDVENSPLTLGVLDVEAPMAVVHEYLLWGPVAEKLTTLGKEKWGGEHHVSWTYHLVEDVEDAAGGLLGYVEEKYLDRPLGKIEYTIPEPPDGDIYRISFKLNDLKALGADLDRWLMFTGPFSGGRPRFLLMENARESYFGFCLGEDTAEKDEYGNPLVLELPSGRTKPKGELTLHQLKVLPSITVQ